MGESINPELVQAACMKNDLSRIRQEELPLNDMPKRGPSYDPRGRNGTSHYSPTFKNDLNNKWAAHIDDDESRKTEGLRIETARPWAAAMTKRILADEASQQPSFFQQRKPSAQFPERPVYGGPVSGGPVQQNPLPTHPVTQKPPQNNSVQLNPILPSPPSKKLGFQKLPTKSAVNSTKFLVATGTCDVLPGGRESDRFQADFEFILYLDKNQAYLHLSAPGKAVRNHSVTDFESPDIGEEGICVLKSCKSLAAYFLRLSDLDETKKFQKIFKGLQHSVAVHHVSDDPTTVEKVEKNKEVANNTVTVPEASASRAAVVPTTTAPAVATSSIATPVATTPIVAPTPIVASTPIVVPPMVDAPVANDTIASSSTTDIPIATTPTPSLAPTEGTLIELDGFQQVENTEMPTLTNAADHIIRLVDKIITHFTLEEHLIDSVVEGIEDGAVEYWVQHGFMRDYNDELKENFIAVLRNMAQIKLKMHLRQVGKGKKPDVKVSTQISEAFVPMIGKIPVVEQIGRIQYSPEAMKKLQDNAAVPSDWNAVEGLPVSAAVRARAALQNIDAVVQHSNDGDIVMANTEEAESDPAPVSFAYKSAPKDRDPTKGLSNSRWASTSSNTNASGSASSARDVQLASLRGVNGLSSSRYATKMVPFHGHFPGPK